MELEVAVGGLSSSLLGRFLLETSWVQVELEEVEEL